MSQTENYYRITASRAYDIFSKSVAESDQAIEHIWIAHFDDQSRCINLTQADGSASGARMPVKSIISDAANLKSSSIIVAHNHPSGDSRPSESDCRVTRRLSVAAEAIDCVLIDHLIFGSQSVSSFRRLGLL